MNKIVMQIGLLVLCIAIIFFAQRGLPVEQILLRSVMVFIFVTIMLSIIAILIVKSVSKTTHKKKDELVQN